MRNDLEMSIAPGFLSTSLRENKIARPTTTSTHGSSRGWNTDYGWPHHPLPWGVPVAAGPHQSPMLHKMEAPRSASAPRGRNSTANVARPPGFSLLRGLIAVHLDGEYPSRRFGPCVIADPSWAESQTALIYVPCAVGQAGKVSPTQPSTFPGVRSTVCCSASPALLLC